jgi:hypothetical protein
VVVGIFQKVIKWKKFSLISQLLLILTAGILLLSLTIANNMNRINYKSLLEVISKAESRGNYNAYFSNPDNQNIKFTSMEVGEVLAWQYDYVHKKGSASNAVGRYQFIKPTLENLVEKENIDLSSTFNEDLQDQLAIALLEKRGINEYVNGEIDIDQFAYNLSKEWAGLPKTKGKQPDMSYYANDGLNKVQVSVDEVKKGILGLKDD